MRNKIFSFLLTLLFCNLAVINPAFAASPIYKPFEGKNSSMTYGGYNYVEGGYFYNSVNLPLSTAKEINLHDNGIVNVANRPPLKMGTSSKTNILGLVDMGNAGVYEAARDGNITKIIHVDTRKERVYVPFILIPIYFTRLVTTVYGE